MLESTLNKVTAFSLNPHLRRMLGQTENKLDFKQMMDEQKVLLADLGHVGEESQRLFGNLITIGMEKAAMSRTGQNRQPFYLCIDEFQDFSGDVGGVKTLSRVLSQTRKFGLFLTLAHQNLSQLTPRMKGAVLGNTWLKILFSVSEEDAFAFARWMSLGTIDTDEVKHEAKTPTQHPINTSITEQEYRLATELANQKPRKAILRDHEGRTKHFWSEALESAHEALAHIPHVQQRSAERYGNPLEQVEQELQRLYESIQSPVIEPVEV
jgi:hypothetical protein